ncbi:MAG: nucleotidyltransferase domain-containing protein [Firmicutes bacterium]|nr:nucleotidyltransferase domain-containing protein [Bacillota bacterium]
MLNIKAEHLKIVMDILSRQVPEYEARAFGSRVNGTARQYSDLDIVLVGKEKLSIAQLAKIEEAFQESDLPFRVDILDWKRISDEFREIIGKGYVVVKERVR